MSQIELSNVFIRGKLEGATGQAKFKLTANSINAVDTINLKTGHITFSYFFNYANLAGASFSAVVNVPDNNVYLEVVSYGDGMTNLYFDGVDQVMRLGRHISNRVFPFAAIIYAAPGSHTITAAKAAAGSADGFIFVRYIRRTGSDNT